MKKNTFLQTSSQTVGPFFAYSLTSEQYKYDFPSLITGNMRKKKIEGHPILITGNVFDGKGETIHDAMIEIWHANPDGKYAISPIRYHCSHKRPLVRWTSHLAVWHHSEF